MKYVFLGGIFLVISFNTFWKFLSLRNPAGDFLGGFVVRHSPG